MPNKPKIFGIGLSRTGTTSLAKALGILGFQATSHPHPLSVIDTRNLDAATDAPVAASFGLLDVKYPRSRFILTVRRDIDCWLDSMEWMMTKWHPKPHSLNVIIRRTLYGCDTFDREKLKEAYHRHVIKVIHYFANRPDLLILDICSGGGGRGSPWVPLCSFLNKKLPTEQFPHLNRRR